MRQSLFPAAAGGITNAKPPAATAEKGSPGHYFKVLLISATESNALFTELREDSPGLEGLQSGAGHFEIRASHTSRFRGKHVGGFFA